MYEAVAFAQEVNVTEVGVDREKADQMDEIVDHVHLRSFERRRSIHAQCLFFYLNVGFVCMKLRSARSN